VVSHFAALELPRRLPQRLKDASNNVEQAFTSAFLEVEREIPPEARHSGSTAIALYRKGDQLYVANTGDSLAIVVAYDPLEDRVNIVYETKPHKPALPEERKRIESLGGQVLLPEQMSEKDTSSRVIVPLEGQFMALAMSRSIGDKEATELGVIANPTVDTLNLKKWEGEKLFAIAASDGLWDHVKPIDVAKHLATSLYKKSEGVVSPLEACEQLIMQSSRRWIAEGIPYRDDISIAISKII
jgi:serine/threonine protein phosphatase PrpC